MVVSTALLVWFDDTEERGLNNFAHDSQSAFGN
ncbi:hypothetical protein FOPG_15160 [Fusarium oxysporum f. sp. conglutinans race 2 54008]|uniref:Uncharacterized protein n=1 Tax=Fusarium oxysporum f. sp. conglutinans race 2 54008 TaxID=1089457 RepID=X0HA57_FUSOX|nr:hypothetical protein FOPG_15160 [Fusarium oxysporum f. sp. conglutinans race 2 54008]